jgi:two-component system OmpR family response regulator
VSVLMRVLVVDDDASLREALRRALSLEGYEVELAADGMEALGFFRDERPPPDAVVLDVLMPTLDGWETCRAIRLRSSVPVLMLTARDSVEDRVEGLDGGADDYLTKPFSLAELSARLRALFRRQPNERPTVLEVGDIQLDPSRRSVSRDGTAIDLSAKEFALLETFMRSPGRVLTRFHLLEHAWDYSYEHRSNVVDVYIRYLREKLDRPFGVESIETVRGSGYRLRVDGGR